MTPRWIRTACMGGFLIVGALALLTLRNPAQAQGEAQHENAQSNDYDGAHHPRIKSFAVETTDETLTYPSYLLSVPDEHTTIMPLPWPYSWQAPGARTYLVFASSKVQGGTTGGAVVFETTDLKNFGPATAWGYNHQVMVPPVGNDSCDGTHDAEFDEGYAAPGSVVQDPTRPPGNLIMIYEAENHCLSGTLVGDYYATVGFARSSDNGRTWPPPASGEWGNADRHPVLKQFDPEPSTPVTSNEGDAIPSAFVDKDDKGEAYLYVTYTHYSGANEPPPHDWLIRVARAKLGEDDHEWGDDDAGSGDSDRQDTGQKGQLKFYKWYDGKFSQPGIGGFDSGVLPPGGCTGTQEHRHMSEITYNDDLRLYLMVYVCNPSSPGNAAWYYSTATSLDREDWTAPQMVVNSEHTKTSPCEGGKPGSVFDGFYPSLMSPGSAAGHTRLRGLVFFLNGCDDYLPRQFASRTFTITTEP